MKKNLITIAILFSSFLNAENNHSYVLKVNKLLAKTPKALNEAKGVITADYQNYLEKEWLSSLRKKYTITVDKEVLKTIK